MRIVTMSLSNLEISFKACGNTQANKAENKDIPIIREAEVVKSGVIHHGAEEAGLDLCQAMSGCAERQRPISPSGPVRIRRQRACAGLWFVCGDFSDPIPHSPERLDHVGEPERLLARP